MNESKVKLGKMIHSRLRKINDLMFSPEVQKRDGHKLLWV